MCELRFNCLRNGAIFSESFENFNTNNTLSFSSSKRIAVVYAPNGVGKTTLADTLARSQDTYYCIEYAKTSYRTDTGDSIFHIINDQNTRNIISGSTEEFILGENIREEKRLEDLVQSGCEEAVAETKRIFASYGIKAKNSKVLSDFCTEELMGPIGELVKQGANRDSVCVAALRQLKDCELGDTTGLIDSNAEECIDFLNLYNDKKSIIRTFLDLNLPSNIRNVEVGKVGENADAIRILEKYIKRSKCIVCDNSIDSVEKLNYKRKSQDNILCKLDDEARDKVRIIESFDDTENVFHIKMAVEKLYETGEEDSALEVRAAIQNFGKRIVNSAIYQIKEYLGTAALFDYVDKLEKLRNEALEITNEDELLLKTIIEQSMDKKVELVREGDNRHITIKLGGQEILNEFRDKLPLSAGEQNFVSLAFEMLRAKNSDSEIVVFDDPISSFDSIYKYKIIYTLLSSLREKSVIILTHNLEAVRLMRHQNGDCFSMYIFNNCDGGENGFIKVPEKEIGPLTDLSKLTGLLRNILNNSESIIDKKLFLISIIPFMRSFAHIIGSDTYSTLVKLMHGRESQKINVADCYKVLFGGSISSSDYQMDSFSISVDDIIKLKLPVKCTIVNTQEYPLLNKALVSTVKYLRARLLVERMLVDYFNIPSSKRHTNDIILSAYPKKTGMSLKNRTRLMVKKTLLNEFNHFEGNLSIFQPAIDISDQSLEREIEDINDFFKSDKWKDNSG